MLVDAVAMCLIVQPVALVDITVGVNETAFAVGLIIAPVALEIGAVLPDLDASAVALAIFPLALVNRSVFEFVCIEFRQVFVLLLVLVINKRG